MTATIFLPNFLKSSLNFLLPIQQISKLSIFTAEEEQHGNVKVDNYREFLF